jgi:glycerol transport system ATP-binding protein
VVMNDGQVVQTGTPVELFEEPRHTFVGHFIGSPGMNLLPCEMRNGKASFAGAVVETGNAGAVNGKGGKLELGVRPEFVSVAQSGIPAEVVKVSDAGRYRVVDTRASGFSVKLLVPENAAVPEGSVHLSFDQAHTLVYEDGWMAGGRP